MKRALQAGLLAAMLLWAGFAAAAQSAVPIDDPLRVDFPPGAGVSESKVAAGVRDGGNYRGWRVESAAPGSVILSTNVTNKHMARVEVMYTSSGYTLRYLQSQNLRYRADTRVIHPNYNLWVRKLAESINEALGVRASVGIALAVVPTAVAVGAATSAPAAEGMPAPGTRWRYVYRDQQYPTPERMFTVEIAGVEGLRVQQRFTADGAGISQDLFEGGELRFSAYPVSDSASVLELAPYAPDLYKRVPTAPSGYPSPAGVMWEVDKPVYGEEQITVPAGTFATLRVEVSGSAHAFGQTTSGTAYSVPTRFIYTAWYSQELKRYVKTRHQTWNRWAARIGDEQVQLIAYQPGK